MTSQNLVVQSRNDILKGSKSFSMASFFFGQKERWAAWQLYSWCRYCDDQVDETSGELAQIKLESLQKMTAMAFQAGPLHDHPWQAFQAVVRDHQIPQKYAQDLLRGMKWDVAGATIKTEEDLTDYCYCVAGTVGLMMCHIMGLDRESALDEAVHLGIALQMTNIARDLKEDFERNRVYLPKTWLDEVGLDSTNLLQSYHRSQLKVLSDRLLKLADFHYDQGLTGLRALPWRSALAVSVAAYVYRDIGHQVRSGDLSIFERRVVVSGKRKIFLAIKAASSLAKLAFERWKSPWQPVVVSRIWGEK